MLSVQSIGAVYSSNVLTVLATHRFFTPLEQFEVVNIQLLPFSAFGVTNLAVLLGLNLTLIGVWLAIFEGKVESRYDMGLYGIYQLVRAIVKENLYIRKQQYFTPIFYLFIIILLANLAGMIPYSFTVTSSFAFTLFLALMYFIGVNLVAAYQHRWRAADLFLPTGAPLMIAPFLIFIEAVSYVARVFSLSIRLFANMMSGHALLKILIGFSWNLLTAGTAAALLAIAPWGIVTMVMFLELLIAFLQAYVFTILVTLYINDVLVTH